jgi:hypothetical protein
MGCFDFLLTNLIYNRSTQLSTRDLGSIVWSLAVLEVRNDAVYAKLFKDVEVDQMDFQVVGCIYFWSFL